MRVVVIFFLCVCVSGTEMLVGNPKKYLVASFIRRQLQNVKNEEKG